MKTIIALICLVAVCGGADPAPPVKLTEDNNLFTLDNGIVAAQVSKRSGDLISLRYKDLEMLGSGSGHADAYWSHAAGPGPRIVNSVTIDPAKNGGERAEVSVKGFSQGAPLGRGPGGSAVADIEIRYALGRGESGVYTYSIFEHKPDFPATSIGEARFGAKLNDRIFDYMTVDEFENAIEKVNCQEREIACGVMFRKECLFDIGLYDESFKMREGHDLRRRFERKFRVARLEFPLYKYRIHGKNRTLNIEEVAKFDRQLDNSS